MKHSLKICLFLCVILSACNTFEYPANLNSVAPSPVPDEIPVVPPTEDELRYHKLSSGLAASTCLVTGTDQHVECWGTNGNGQLGNNSVVSSLTPVSVLEEDLSVLTDVVSITGGDAHLCVLMKDKTVKCWGAASNLGLSDNLRRLVATTVPGLSNIVAIESSDYHTCAINSARELYCWGFNNRGQIGNGNTTNQVTPLKVPGLSGVRVISVSPRATYAVLFDGTLWVWGENFNGSLLGDSATAGHVLSPRIFPGITTAVSVSAANPYACAILADKKTVCWGYTFMGGVPAVASREIPELSNALELAGGFDHICARKSGSSIRCIGYNGAGQLGDGTFTRPATPTNVVSLPVGEVLAEIRALDEHTCARFVSGAVYCWGKNGSGQLGNGLLTNSNVPVEVLGL